jgi:lysophospholipase L1-like esterase
VNLRPRLTIASIAVLLGAGVAVSAASQRQLVHSSPKIPKLTVTRFVAIGDSLTLGETGIGPGALVAAHQDYPSRLAALLGSHYSTQRFTVVNAGIGGERAGQAAARIAQVLGGAKYDVLLLMEGTNDLVDHEAAIAPWLDSLQRIIAAASASGVETLVATLPPQRIGSPRAWAGTMVPVFNERLETAARERGWQLVDVHASFTDLTSLLSADGLHLTPAGDQRVAQTFYRAIQARYDARLATVSTE